MVTVTGLSAAAFTRAGQRCAGGRDRHRLARADPHDRHGERNARGGDTVQVGTQVSGTIQSLGADFNSIVKKGQVLARLDPSLIQAEIERAKANLLGAEADVQRAQVLLTDAETKLNRAQELAARQLIPTSDLEAAQVRSARARRRSAASGAGDAGASLAVAGAGQPAEDRHRLADRRHRDLAFGRCRPDGRRQPPGADALHDCRGSEGDAAQGEHR